MRSFVPPSRHSSRPRSLSLGDSVKSGCLNGAQMLPIFHVKECIFIYINFSEGWHFGMPLCVCVCLTQTFLVPPSQKPCKALTRKPFVSMMCPLSCLIFTLLLRLPIPHLLSPTA